MGLPKALQERARNIHLSSLWKLRPHIWSSDCFQDMNELTVNYEVHPASSSMQSACTLKDTRMSHWYTCMWNSFFQPTMHPLAQFRKLLFKTNTTNSWTHFYSKKTLALHNSESSISKMHSENKRRVGFRKEAVLVDHWHIDEVPFQLIDSCTKNPQ